MYKPLFSIMFDLESPKDGCMHPMRSRAWERSNPRFPTLLLFFLEHQGLMVVSNHIQLSFIPFRHAFWRKKHHLYFLMGVIIPIKIGWTIERSTTFILLHIGLTESIKIWFLNNINNKIELLINKIWINIIGIISTFKEDFTTIKVWFLWLIDIQRLTIYVEEC